MDKKERLMAVLNHQKPDRIPASFWFHFDGEKGRGEACVQAHLDYYHAANPDFIKIMSDGLGYPLSVTIGRAEDWYKVAPLPDDDPFFTETVARCAAINQAVGEECYTFYNFFSPYNIIREREVFTSAYQNSNRNETVKTHMQENPDAVRHAMCVIAGDLARLAERVVHEGGCLGIYQSLQGAEIGHLSESMHADVVRPADLQLIRAINEISPYNILHLCSWAGFPNHLAYWKDYPGRVVNWGTGVENLSLAEGRSLFGPDRVILGGLDNRRGKPLYSGTREELKAAVRAAVEQMAGEPFILGADCTVPNDIDLERIGWVLEALEEES